MSDITPTPKPRPASIDAPKDTGPQQFPFEAWEFDEPNVTNPQLTVKAPWYLGARYGLHVEQASNAYTRMPVVFARDPVSSSTGAIKITIPESRAMVEMMVMIHQYDSARNSDKICQLLISGYLYTVTPVWNSPGCVMTGKMHHSTEMVRWARGPSGEWCILLGETGTVWNYPFVEVIWAHADWISVDCMRSEWAINFGITSTTGYTMDHTRETLRRASDSVGVFSVSADTTIYDDDGISQLLVTASATRTITLPTAADNQGRVIIIEKVDTGTGYVTVDGEGSETINGQTTWTLHYIRDFIQIICDGSGWRILSEARPVGEIIAMARHTDGTPEPAPEGFLLCDGNTASRTTYARLFAAIGTAWGNGDGSTTFNLPTCDGVFLRGMDSGTTYDPDSASRVAVVTGGSTGRNVGSYQDHALDDHTHNHSTYDNGLGDYPSNTAKATSSSAAGTDASGGAQGALVSTETRPRNVYVAYYIRY